MSEPVEHAVADWSRLHGERALRIFCPKTGIELLRFVETEDGCVLSLHAYVRDLDNNDAVLHLDPDQLRQMGLFLVSLFMAERPSALLTEIRGAAMFAINELEAWNERAREDEEHPPYVEINNRLRRIEWLLDELNKGLH